MTTLVKRLLRASTRCPVSGRKVSASAAAVIVRNPADLAGKADAYATDWTSSVLSYDNYR